MSVGLCGKCSGLLLYATQTSKPPTAKTIRNNHMKIITISEEIGLIWYVAKNFKQRDIHTIIYGLQIRQYETREEAQKEHQNCLNHYWDSCAL